MRRGIALIVGGMVAMAASAAWAEQPIAADPAPWHIVRVAKADAPRVDAALADPTAGPSRYLQLQLVFSPSLADRAMHKFRVVNREGEQVGELYGHYRERAVLVFENQQSWDSLKDLYLDGLNHREPLLPAQPEAPRAVQPAVPVEASVESPSPVRVTVEAPRATYIPPAEVHVPGTTMVVPNAAPRIIAAPQIIETPGATRIIRSPTHVVYLPNPAISPGDRMEGNRIEDRVEVVGSGTAHVVHDGTRVIHDGAARVVHDGVDVLHEGARLVAGGGAASAGVAAGGGGRAGGSAAAGMGAVADTGAKPGTGAGGSAGNGPGAGAQADADPLAAATIGPWDMDPMAVAIAKTLEGLGTGGAGTGGSGVGDSGAGDSGAGDSGAGDSGAGAGDGARSQAGSGGSGLRSESSLPSTGRSGAGTGSDAGAGPGAAPGQGSGAGKGPGAGSGEGPAAGPGGGTATGLGEGFGGGPGEGPGPGEGEGPGPEETPCPAEGKGPDPAEGPSSGPAEPDGPRQTGPREAAPGQTGPPDDMAPAENQGPLPGMTAPAGQGSLPGMGRSPGAGGTAGSSGGGAGGAGGVMGGGAGGGADARTLGPNYVNTAPQFGPRSVNLAPHLFDAPDYRGPELGYYAPEIPYYSPAMPGLLPGYPGYGGGYGGGGGYGYGGGYGGDYPKRKMVPLPPPVDLPITPALVLYISCGDPLGPGQVFQVNEHGHVLGIVNLPFAATGLAMHRKHGLVAAIPRDGGKLMRIDDTGKVTTILEKDQNIVHPVDVALAADSDTIVVADNITDCLAVLTTAGSKPKLYRRFPDQKWDEQMMSVAVTTDKHVIFGTNGGEGIFRFAGDDYTAGRGPLLAKQGGVAADTSSLKWAATQSPDRIVVFEGEEQVKEFRLPANMSFFRQGLVAFGLEGAVIVAARPSDMPDDDPWLIQYETEDNPNKPEVTNLFKWNRAPMLDFVVGPRMFWDRHDPKPYKSYY